MKHPLFSLFCFSLVLGAQALASPPTQPPAEGLAKNSGLIVYPDSSSGDLMLSWWGYDEHFYFIQHSDDLVNWTYLPVYEEGFESAHTWGFQITGDRQFWRLKYSNDPTSDLLSADFSGTGISNWTEIQFGLDPFDPVDSDGVGLPDAWQLYYFGQLGVDPHADVDGDGFTNLQEFQAGTNPLDYWDRPGGAPNIAPTVTVPADQILVWPDDTVTLTAAAIDTDEGPSPLTFSWTVVSGSAGVAFTDASASTTDATFPSQGTWLLRFTASDGEASASATVAVNVVDEPEVMPQALRFVSPADGAWVEQGKSLLVWLNSDELDDPVVEVEVFRDGVSILLFEEDPEAWENPTTWSDNFTEGGFGYVTYEAVATHESGLATTSEITVFSAPLGTPPPGGGGGGTGGGGGAGPGGPVSGNVAGSITAASLPDDGPLGFSETDHSVTTLDQDVIEEEEELYADPGQVLLIEVVVDSAEYPTYTGDGSQFNDTVFWSITPSWGSGTVSGSHSVNELHTRFEEGDGTAIVGIFAVTFPFDGDPNAEPYVTLKGSVQNIADGAFDTTVSFRSTKVNLVPDYDRDGVIREEEATVNGETRLSDYDRARSREIFHFWRNDDNDDPGSEVDGEDTPGQAGGGDGRQATVQGTRDLVDFFPVFIDLQDFLQAVELEDVRIHLVQPGLNFIEPQSVLSQGWTKSEANDYLRNPATARLLQNAQKQEARASNPLSEAFLEEAKAGRGILLFDGRASSTDDLRLVVQYKGNQLFDLRLPMRISPVEEMYRRLNVSNNPGFWNRTPTRTGNPEGWPDDYTINRYFLFLHGFNVSQEGARGWHSQMFKRLYWSGFQGRFVGVTWHGNQALGNYYAAVRNAKVSSGLLLNGINNHLNFIAPNQMVVAAHSLGNMVVGNAIRGPESMWDSNYNPWTPDQYFMLNAAVPIEAYGSTQTVGSGVPMWENIRHPDWRVGGVDYAEQLTAPFWYDLFQDTQTVSGDGRQYLTWKDRFTGFNFATNFFSSGEDVLRNANGSVPSLFGQITNRGVNAWTFQEMRKGTGGLSSASLSPTQGGWGFNSEDEAPDYYDNGVRLTPQQMENIADHELREVPFHRNFVEDFEVLHNPHGHPDAIALSYENDTHYRLLSSAIPATSFAAGANEVEAFDTPTGNRNFNQQNYQTPGEWPTERLNGQFGNQWLHSDLKNVAYPYVYQIFDLIVEQGGLK